MKDNTTMNPAGDFPHDNAATTPRQSLVDVRIPRRGLGRKSAVTAVLLLTLAAVGMLAFPHALAQSAPSAAASPATKPAKVFTVFDAMLFKDKPDLAGHWVKPMVSLGASLFATKQRPSPAQMEQPDESLLRATARSLARRKTIIVSMDIEHWPTTGDPDEVAATVEKYVKIAQWMHDEVPGLRLGFYGVPPVGDYWNAQQPVDSPRYQNWQKQNDALMEIARQSDVLFPSLYTFYENQAGWVTFAKANIAEARRYNKVVYPYLWPEYHDAASPELRGKPIPAAYWRLQLETVYEHADGVVIWGGWQKTWDEQAPWWQETLKFLKEKGISPG